MCTVVIRVPEESNDPIRILAVRDEEPKRPWNPPVEWWPTRPGVVGVQDQLAGGAWLAASRGAHGGRLSVILNRLGVPNLPAEQIISRGNLLLDSVAGQPLTDAPRTMGFNLVSVADGIARLSSWDGRELKSARLNPGTHMIAHGDLDDVTTPRIIAWREEFTAAERDGSAAEWWRPWLGVLEFSAKLSPEDDRAIIRDNRAHGYPTLSLLACMASIGETATDLRYAQLDEAGVWSDLDFTSPVTDTSLRKVRE